MRHDAGMFTAEQTEAVIGVTVAFGGRGELPHPGNFPIVFTQMTLQRQRIACLQGFQARHQRVGAAWNEARRQDRFRTDKAAVCRLDPCLRIAQRGLHVRLPHAVRAIPVHIHLSDEALQPGAFQLLHQVQRGCRMDGCEDRGPRGRGMYERVCKVSVGLSGVNGIAVFCLLGKGIGIKPVEKLQIHSHTAKGKLRRVKMQIAHPGQDQPISVICDRQAPIGFRDDRYDPAADPVNDWQKSVFNDPDPVRTVAVEKTALYDIVFHEGPPFHVHNRIIIQFCWKSNRKRKRDRRERCPHRSADQGSEPAAPAICRLFLTAFQILRNSY